MADATEIDDQLMEAYYGDSRLRGRFNFKDVDGFGKECMIGVSLPLDMTPVEARAAYDTIKDAMAQVDTFKALPYEKQLEKYLIDAYKALDEITRMCQQNVHTISEDAEMGLYVENDYASLRFRELQKLRGDIFCKAEGICMLLPSDFRPDRT